MMQLKQAWERINRIAACLWRESATASHPCTQAKLAMKEKARKKPKDSGSQGRRFWASDSLLDHPRQLRLCEAHDGIAVPLYEAPSTLA